MIPDALFNILFAPVRLILGLIPSVSIPTYLDRGDCAVNCEPNSLQYGAFRLGEGLGKFKQWIPVADLFSVLTVVVAAWALYLAVRAARSLISLVTGGGGS